MRNILVRAVLFAVIAALYFPVNLLLNRIDASYSAAKEITFELPFPDDISKRYGIGQVTGDDIEAVYISGFFSDWSPDNTNYIMSRVAPGRWKITMRFDTGRNQYKFAVVTKAKYFDSLEKAYKNVIWSEGT